MIQYRIRTEYSFGSTFAPIPRVIDRLKAIGCTAAGIVDMDGTWGHYAWQQACREASIQPMFGVDLIVADHDDVQTRMWFLARNVDGLKELYHFTSNAYKQRVNLKFGSRPRLYRADVVSMSDDVLVFAGDVTDEDFLKKAGAILDFSPASRILNMSKKRLAGHLDSVDVSDNAYSSQGEKSTLEILSKWGTKTTPQHIIDFGSELGRDPITLPEQRAPEDFDMPTAPMLRVEGDLEALCREGIEYRAKHNKLVWDDDYEARLQRELELIKSKDYESYFLIVADMTIYAKQHMLVGPSRGSAAGSLVCYLARITEIDPMPPKLYFERFIDVSRTDLPDIDLDFVDTKRAMVFKYMAEQYGDENVAHIGTISKYRPKSALIQVAKRLRIPPQATGGVKVAMIERSSADSRANDCLRDTLDLTEPGKALKRMYPQVEMAADIEGHASHTGVHAAGLLVCNQPIMNFCTVTDDGIAQVEKGAAESLGLLKIDVLGLRTLGVLEDAGVDIDYYTLPLDDEKTMEVFNRGALSGIFQFEGAALRSIAERIEFVDGINDIDAVTALARPGPFMGGVTEEWIDRREGKKYKPIHELVERHMTQTYGLPVYQEQTLAIVREIGLFNWKDTSLIRKAMSKSMGREFFENFWPQFKEGAESQGINEQDARKTWELINNMGSWQMNKAHTYSYAVISYWCAYLKAHHPIHFAASALRNAKDEASAISLLQEMNREGIDYKRFDPQLSEESWSVQDGELVAGYDSLHGFGPAKSQKYIKARAEGKLTQDMIDKALAAPSPFDDIFPIKTRFGEYYSNPDKFNVGGKVHLCEEFDGSQDGSCIFIGELIQKNLRDINEEVLVKKRGEKRLKGPQTFLDLRFRDDTDQILVRINRYDYKKIGEKVFNEVEKGAIMMVRARFPKGIRFGFVQKLKRIDANG